MGDEPSGDSDHQISVPIPLDADRFLMRECPSCEREFRWHVSDEGEDSEAVPSDGYHCPYCDTQASADSWFTKAQADFMSASAMHEVAPGLDEILGGMERDTGSVRIEVTGSLDPGEPAPLQENLDTEMRLVEFPCHPSEPLKVDPEWPEPVHCLLCGQLENRE